MFCGLFAPTACMLVVRLYEQYIEGSSIKEVDSLLERAMEVPLFKSTRRELGIKESDNSLQKFRLALCVMCGETCLHKAWGGGHRTVVFCLESGQLRSLVFLHGGCAYS